MRGGAVFDVEIAVAIAHDIRGEVVAKTETATLAEGNPIVDGGEPRRRVQ